MTDRSFDILGVRSVRNFVKNQPKKLMIYEVYCLTENSVFTKLSVQQKKN